MGITDGYHVCNLCGESITSCYLCADDPSQHVVSRVVEMKKAEQEMRDAEIELWRQEKSIRDNAERRRMYGNKG